VGGVNIIFAYLQGDENLLLTMSGTLLVTVLAGVASVKIGDFVGLVRISPTCLSDICVSLVG
jgi:hypothetical protein